MNGDPSVDLWQQPRPWAMTKVMPVSAGLAGPSACVRPAVLRRGCRSAATHSRHCTVFDVNAAAPMAVQSPSHRALGATGTAFAPREVLKFYASSRTCTAARSPADRPIACCQPCCWR